MNGRNVAHSSLWVLLISGFFGCAGAGPFVTLPSSAFFETDVTGARGIAGGEPNPGSAAGELPTERQL
jgi:hypothetical protein